MKTLFAVQSFARGYPVCSLDLASLISELGREDGAAVIIDERIVELHPSLAEPLRQRAIAFLPLAASESQKSFEALGPILSALFDAKVGRRTRLYVIGGGTIQDAGSFVASIIGRGMNWDLVPTTLLAQADSCIGSKTSLNFGARKNQLGTFYPPSRVLLCSEFLKTLKWDDLRSGVCEILKIALVKGWSEFTARRAQLSQLAPDCLDSLEQAAIDSLAIKKQIVELDEFDRGPRAFLNLGHTLGHALESVSDYRVPHGIAVGIGTAFVSALAVKCGALEEDYSQTVGEAFARWVRPYDQIFAQCDPKALIAAMMADKKNTAADAITFVLPHGAYQLEQRKIETAVLLEALAGFSFD